MSNINLKPGGKNRLSLTQDDIDKMVNYLKEGKTLEWVGRAMNISKMSVYTYTNKIIGKRGYKRVSNEQIIELIKKGKNQHEIAYELGTNVDRVYVLMKRNLKLIPKKNVELTDRQKEIKKIGIEIQRQKKLKVTEVIEKQLEYKVGNAGNCERVLDIDVIATYHKEQRVW